MPPHRHIFSICASVLLVLPSAHAATSLTHAGASQAVIHLYGVTVNSANTGPLRDADGLSNLAEYALGGNPNADADTPHPPPLA